MHESVWRQIEPLGYATSAHRMGDYCEVHAVKLPDGELVRIARAEGDGDEEVYLAAWELARMCGVELED
jgi:hypothetical protein